MRIIARWMLLVDHRIYDLLAILLISTGTSFIVSSGGNEYEFILLRWGVVCVLTSIGPMYLRNKRATIDSNVDAEWRRYQDALFVHGLLLNAKCDIPVTTRNLAEAATKIGSKSALLVPAISLILASSRVTKTVILAFSGSVLSTIISALFIAVLFYFPENEDISRQVEKLSFSVTRLNRLHTQDALENRKEFSRGLEQLRIGLGTLSSVVSNNNEKTSTITQEYHKEVFKNIIELRQELSIISYDIKNILGESKVAIASKASASELAEK